MEEKKFKNEFVSGVYTAKPHSSSPKFIVAKGYIVVDQFVKAYTGQEKVFFQITTPKDESSWKLNTYIDAYNTEKDKGEKAPAKEKVETYDAPPKTLEGIDFGPAINPDDIPF